MEHFKRSTSRDFRINCATLDAALREESSEEDEEVLYFLYNLYSIKITVNKGSENKITLFLVDRSIISKLSFFRPV